MAWATPEPVAVEAKDKNPTAFKYTEAERLKYAGELLREPENPIKCAQRIWGGGQDVIGFCAWAASAWPNDPEFQALQRSLISEQGEDSFLPTKREAVLRIWNWTETGSKDEKIKAMKLLAEISGWIEKPEDPSTKAVTSLMPPSIIYEVGADHDKPPSADTPA